MKFFGWLEGLILLFFRLNEFLVFGGRVWLGLVVKIEDGFFCNLIWICWINFGFKCRIGIVKFSFFLGDGGFVILLEFKFIVVIFWLWYR